MIIYISLNEMELRELVVCGELHKTKVGDAEIELEEFKQSLLRDKVGSTERYCLDGYIKRPESVSKDITTIAIEEDDKNVLKYNSSILEEIKAKDRKNNKLDYSNSISLIELMKNITNKQMCKLDRCLIWKVKLNQIVKWE